MPILSPALHQWRRKRYSRKHHVCFPKCSGGLPLRPHSLKMFMGLGDGDGDREELEPDVPSSPFPLEV